MTGLTPAGIDAMPAGPEMDALVAERVMGWKEVSIAYASDDGSPHPVGRPPDTESWETPFQVALPYSTSDAAALEVLKKLVTLNLETDKKVDALYYWPCSNEWDDVLNKWKPGETWEVCRIGYDGTENGTAAPTLALAICRAALKAATK